MNTQMENSDEKASGRLDLGLFSYVVLDWKWLAAGAILSLELASVMLLGWPTGLIPSIRFPYVYGGDALFLQWMAQRATEGWIWTNPRSGFPFGSALYDYPNVDSISLLIEKLFGKLTHSALSAVDLYLLLGFPAAFVSAFLVLRSFNIRKPYCAMAALLFAFTPFHFARLFYGHDFYTWYLIVPVFFYFGKNLFFTGRVCGSLRSPIRLVAMLCAVAILSSFVVYYACFGVIVLIISGAAASSKRGSIKPALSALVFSALILGGAALNLLPSIDYHMSHPVNHEVAERSPIETEVYALKIMHLILPQPGYRIRAVGDYVTHYDQEFPLSNVTSSLGIVGVIGFLSVILAAGAGMAGKTVDPKLGFAGIIVLSLLLISTVGGFNVLFATLVTPIIRAWDRISIFIAFGSILAFTLLIDRWKGLNARRGTAAVAAVTIAALGFLDQTPKSYSASTAGAAVASAVDKGFIQQIEASVPVNSAIYQLPYIGFPESAPVVHLSVYDLGTGFINSKTLRWSFGGVRGRAGDEFYRALATEPAAKQVEVIRKLGFAGIYIDRRGYADRGAAIVAAFARSLNAPPTFERSDGNVAFFNVPDHAEQPPADLDAHALIARAGFEADQYGARSTASLAQGIDFSSSSKLPSFVADMTGLSAAESHGRWSDGNIAKDVIIRFTAPLPDRFTIDLSGVPFGPNTGKKLEVIAGSVRKEIDMPGPFDARVPIDLGGQKVSALEFVPPAPTSPQEMGLSADTRKLGVAFKTLKIE